MKINEITYTVKRVIPTRQYAADHIDITASAQLEEGEDPIKALAALREQMLPSLKQELDTAEEVIAAKPLAQITFLRRDVTSHSASPLWRCTTEDGRTVNIFKHGDPQKDNFHLFEEAGYAEWLNALDVGDAQNWKGYPIVVTLAYDGKFWNITRVKPREADALPDGEEPDTLRRLRGANQQMNEDGAGK
jgi:hypothetical protein